MLVLADVGNVAGDARTRLNKWIENGGVLVRFAGPRLAAATDDDLVPVKLRAWRPHSRRQPELGSAATPRRVRTRKSIRRHPGPDDVTDQPAGAGGTRRDLSDRTWATLGDGTPLVTAARQGKGLIVLFHVSADTRWSNLPLSGVFVEMLKRLVALAGSTPGRRTPKATAPSRIPRPAGAADPRARRFWRHEHAARHDRASDSRQLLRPRHAEHPPGFYGPPEGLIAVNTLAPGDQLTPLDYSDRSMRAWRPTRSASPRICGDRCSSAALALLLIDALMVFWLAGGFGSELTASGAGRRSPRDPGARVVGSVALAPSRPRPNDPIAMKATLKTRLAYVVTGNAEVDGVSKAGLQGLTLFLAQRTALEAGEPIGLDISRDELSFFPLIYWPVVPDGAKPSPQALQRSTPT